MLIESLILALSIPSGFFIAYLTNDELVAGRKWFLALIFLGISLGAFFIYLKNLTVVFSLVFLIIVSCISYWKSFDKEWIKRRV